MNIKPQKGMQEYLPEAAAQRDRLMNLILETYTASGFTRIYTPAIESAENLDKSDGGDNLNLIFRIMKRGDKLAEALAKNPVDEKELCDLGLREQPQQSAVPVQVHSDRQGVPCGASPARQAP